MNALLMLLLLGVMSRNRRYSGPRREDGLDRFVRNASKPVEYPTDGGHWQDRHGIGK